MPELQERDAAAMPNPDADPPPPFQLTRVLRNRGPSWPIGCSSLRCSRFWTTDTPVPRGCREVSVNPAFLPVRPRARLFRDTTCVAVSETPHNGGPPRVSDSGSRRIAGEDRAPAAVRARRDSHAWSSHGGKNACKASAYRATRQLDPCHNPCRAPATVRPGAHNAETAYRVTKEPPTNPRACAWLTELCTRARGLGQACRSTGAPSKNQ